jgi:hypothetical protein
MLLEIEAEPASGEAARSGQAASVRLVPLARAPRRSSRGRSLARSSRRARGCRVPAPTGRSFEDGPARSTLLLLGPRRSRKSRGRVARLIPESIPDNEPSDPKSARPSPRGVCASAVSVEPLGSRERYTCYLQRFNPSFAIASRRQPDPQNVWARSDLRGKRLKPSRRMICASRGPAFGPCGWPNASAVGRG